MQGVKLAFFRRVCSYVISVRDIRSNHTFLTDTITSKNGAVYTVVLTWSAVSLAAKHLLYTSWRCYFHLN